MVYGAARVCKGINLRGREAYATVPNMSTKVSIALLPRAVKGKPMMKSILTSHHGCSGTGRDWRTPVLA